MTILKEEINESLATIDAFARWRLFVVSALAAVGLGIHKDMNGFENGYLLLFIAPFVCAYVDFLVYERMAVVFEIAKYLRNYDGQDDETKELQKYERFVHDRRKRHVGTGGYKRWANFSISLGLAIVVPGLSFWVTKYRTVISEHLFFLALPALGILTVVWAFVHYMGRFREMEKQ